MGRFVLPSNRVRTPVRFIFVICALVGFLAVYWRAQTRARVAKARASVEASAYADALELQFNHGLTAVETIGMLARQSGGTVSNFQRVATEVLSARSVVATIELQPGGVVADVVPRAGNERMLGFNTMKDPVQGPGAYAASQVRGVTVMGPHSLFHGEPGFVARFPIYERRDGRDYLRGFVAASMRLQDILARARLGELATRGYNFVLFIPGSAQRKSVTVVAQGTVAMPEAISQTLRSNNLEFRLALHPRGGWVGRMKVVVESLGVLLLSGLSSWMVSLVGKRGEAESERAEAAERLARELESQKQAKEENRRAKEEAAAAQTKLKQGETALQEAQAKVAELQAGFEATVRGAKEANEASQAKLSQAESKAAELQKQLDAVIQEKDEAVKAGKKDDKELHEALRQAETKVTELQTKLDEASRVKKEAVSADRERLEKAETAVARLDELLKVAARSAKEAAAAGAAKLKEVEASYSDLKARLGEKEKPEPKSIEPKVAEPKPSNAPAAQPVAPAAPKAEARQPVPKVEPKQESKPAATTTAPKETPKQPNPKLEAKEVAVAASPKAESNHEKQKPGDGEEGEKAPKRKKAKRDNQMDLFAEPANGEEVVTEPARKLPPPPPVDPPQLRKAVGLIMPLLMEQDPGAKDCLKDNLNIFRSAFSPEGYVEFSGLIQKGDFSAAREELTKAAKKHGIPA